MRAAGITALGKPIDILDLDDLASPAADEVLIDVAAAGIGNWDELVRTGSWRVGGPAQVPFFLPAIGFDGPLRVRALVWVRWPRTGRLRRWRSPR